MEEEIDAGYNSRGNYGTNIKHNKPYRRWHEKVWKETDEKNDA